MTSARLKPHIYPDTESLIEAAADRVVAICTDAIAQRGHCHLALAGGNTPRLLYQRLANRHSGMPWQQIDIWFGDERSVPPEHPDSNYRMARENLLDAIDIPDDRIHRINARPAHIEQDARAYAELLEQTLPKKNQVPVLDLVLLGMGDDGHTASLFPGTGILEVRDRPVAAVYVPRMDSWRISLTYPVLDVANHLLFLVSGSPKAPVIRDLFSNKVNPDAHYPVQSINNPGPIDWFLDSDAAQDIG